MKSLYGTLPQDLGFININNDESCLCLYMPIKLKNRYHEVLPRHLQKYQRILDCVHDDLIIGAKSTSGYVDKYIHLTVKAQFVSGQCTGQRSGWHSDGFMTDDVNYIYYDSFPTEFYDGSKLKLQLTQDHNKSLDELKKMDVFMRNEIVTFPEKHLLKLDQYVIHRPQEYMVPSFRTFVKVSVSDHLYALKGNTINYEPKIYDVLRNVEYKERGVERNCPIIGGSGL